MVTEVPTVIKKSKPLPEWMVVGESVLVRPYNWSGIISFIGATQFASGTWIGISLDASNGNSLLRNNTKHFLKTESYLV